jgi:amino acid transporter
VHWLLVIPYAIVAGVLAYLAAVVALVGVFVILFTKNLPEGMFKLILIPYRWQLRTATYALFMITKYPPFEWDDQEASGATRPAP